MTRSMTFLRATGSALLVLLAAPVWSDVPCTQISNTCVNGPSTRNISGLDVTRDCWEFDVVFRCAGTAALNNDCQALRDRGCSQISSDCATQASDGTCDIYRQTYSCTGPSATQGIVQCGQELFCLSGACANKSYLPNTDFIQAYGGLAGLRAAAADMDKTTYIIFTGIAMDCSRYILNAYDCCDVDGILNNILTCSPGEQALAAERRAKNTHYVGTYCASKVPIIGTCIEDKEVYCDFKSILARIIQEQGRPQLGKDFGTPEAPDCSGFSISEFASLDFNKIDFSEFTNSVTVPAGNTTGVSTGIQGPIQKGSNW